jgi:hypothetical protein
MGCIQSKKINSFSVYLSENSNKYTENELIEYIQLELNRGVNINHIKLINYNGFSSYTSLIWSNPLYNQYYNLFDFIIKNGYLLKRDAFNYINIKHLRILNRYNYDISEYVQYLLKSENIDTLVKISDIYNFANFKSLFLNTYASTKIYYVIALFLTKGYKLSDEEIKHINLEFIEYIADYSAEEWMNNRSCRVCYKKLPADTTPNLCIDCEKEYVKIEKLKLATEKLKEKNMVERF